MILPTIIPIAVLPSVGEPVADVGPPEVELEATEDWVDEPDVDGGTVRVNDPVEEVTDNEEVTDDVVDGVGGRVERDVVRVVGVVVGDIGGKSVVLGGVGPP